MSSRRAESAGRHRQPPSTMATTTRKRVSSFSGFNFLSKLLPSNRPEQGGTQRFPEALMGDNESGYVALSMNPNELRDWSLPVHRDPGSTNAGRIISATATVPATEGPSGKGKGKRPQLSHRHIHHYKHRNQSMPPAEVPPDDVRIYDDLSRFPALTTTPQASSSTPCRLDLGVSPPPASHYRRDPSLDQNQNRPQSHSLTGSEISALLRSKEDTRLRRRDLKEKGDWLGVQGADPYSGQFLVLTPTETISSDTTPPLTRTRLNGLARSKKVAKIAYERARSDEEAEKDRAMVERDRNKLEKLERVKEGLRRAQWELEGQMKGGRRWKWTQHRRQWSSAAEPNLSPIAQSSSSCSDENAATMAATELPPTANIPNFSRPSGSAAGVVASPTIPPAAAAVLEGSEENIVPGPLKDRDRSGDQRRRNQSTDTVVVRKTPNTTTKMFPDIITPSTECTLHPSLFSDEGKPSERAEKEKLKSEKKQKQHFLWKRRRRMSDPGLSIRTSDSNPALLGTSKTTTDSSAAVPPVPSLAKTVTAATSTLSNANRAFVSIADTTSPHHQTALPPRETGRVLGEQDRDPDHFMDLLIPDYHLRLLTPDSERNRDGNASVSPSPGALEIRGSPLRISSKAKKPVLNIVTNFQDTIIQSPQDKSREMKGKREEREKILHRRASSDVSSATATSSRSRLKENTKLLLPSRKIFERFILTRNSTCRAADLVATAQQTRQSLTEIPIPSHGGIERLRDGEEETEMRENSITPNLESPPSQFVPQNLKADPDITPNGRPRSRSMGGLECLLRRDDMVSDPEEQEAQTPIEETDNSYSNSNGTGTRISMSADHQSGTETEIEIPEESAFIHTTTITGYDHNLDPDRQNLLGGKRDERDGTSTKTDTTIGLGIFNVMRDSNSHLKGVNNYEDSSSTHNEIGKSSSSTTNRKPEASPTREQNPSFVPLDSSGNESNEIENSRVKQNDGSCNRKRELSAVHAQSLSFLLPQYHKKGESEKGELPKEIGVEVTVGRGGGQRCSASIPEIDPPAMSSRPIMPPSYLLSLRRDPLIRESDTLLVPDDAMRMPGNWENQEGGQLRQQVVMDGECISTLAQGLEQCHSQQPDQQDLSRNLHQPDFEHMLTRQEQREQSDITKPIIEPAKHNFNHNPNFQEKITALKSIETGNKQTHPRSPLLQPRSHGVNPSRGQRLRWRDSPDGLAHEHGPKRDRLHEKADGNVNDALIHEAARIALQRSRAREVITPNRGRGALPSSQKFRNLREQHPMGLNIHFGSGTGSGSDLSHSGEDVYSANSKRNPKDRASDEIKRDSQSENVNEKNMRKTASTDAITTTSTGRGASRILNLESVSFVRRVDRDKKALPGNDEKPPDFKRSPKDETEDKDEPKESGRDKDENQDNKQEEDAAMTKPTDKKKDSAEEEDAVMTIFQVITILSMPLFALLRVWWRLAAPALDAQSEVWKRRNEGRICGCNSVEEALKEFGSKR
ncbi:hypothetical protein F5Y16DRAFT_425320 [Xylariaceae sp. FL0255]|nr:hypothetical protein F5Y16DRAFT_425320 [Xylariaceae sp. FL0255]